MNIDHGRSLRLAVINNDIGQVKALLTEGVDVDSADDAGWTALLIAMRRKYYDIAWVLLNAGASVDKCTAKGNSVIDYATLHGDFELVKYIDKRLISPPNYQSLFYRALYRYNIPLIRYYLTKGADPKIDEYHLYPNLFIAISTNDPQVVRLLLDKGVDVNETKAVKETPIMHAIHQANMEIMKLLLDYGAELNAVDEHGRTVLGIAKQLRLFYSDVEYNAERLQNIDNAIEFLINSGAIEK